MSDEVILTDVVMRQSTGQKTTMPTSAPDGQLLIARVAGGPSELWCGTGDGVEQLGGGGSSSGSATFNVTQANHGFNNEFVSFNGTQWVKAYANDVTSTTDVLNSAVGYATSVSEDVFTVTTFGKISGSNVTDADGNALVPGQFYFLCQESENAGKMTAIKPAGGTVQTVAQALSASEFVLMIQEPINLNEFQYGGSQRIDFTVSNLVSNILTVNHALNTRNVLISVYDSTGSKVNPSSVTITSESTVQIDLSGKTVTGTWYVVLQGGVLSEVDELPQRAGHAGQILVNDGVNVSWSNTLDCIYNPTDLTVRHANEINENFGGDAWAWVHDRIQKQNWTGINIGDYIPVQLKGGTIGGAVTIATNQQHYLQVAGIDTYYNFTDVPVPHHIDFICRNTIGATSIWNEGNTNNGTAAEPNPYLSSRIYAILNGVNNYTTSAQGNLKHGLNCSSGGILQMLPAELQNVLIEKRCYNEAAYSASAQITYPTTGNWGYVGKVWIPDEVEVYGYLHQGYVKTEAKWNPSCISSVQYPLFRYQTRVKTSADNTSSRQNWWLRNSSTSAATNVCNVHATGSASTREAANTNISVCFGLRVA